MNTQGILFFATSHPYFGRMAANLVMTIKANSPGTQVAVITDGIGLKHLDDNELALFDRIITMPEIGMGLGEINRLRLRLNELTPFDETIAMDVDMLWLPKRDPAAAFSLLNDRDFTIVNEGYFDLETGIDLTNGYTHWADVKDIKEAYNLKGRLFQARGEFIVFRKGERVAELFQAARNIMDAPAVPVLKLADSITDEFALNIAMNQLGMQPHLPKWQPAYWPAMNGNRLGPLYKLESSYFALSFGGNTLLENARQAYGMLSKDAARRLGMKFRFPIYPKKQFLLERREN